jgi:hypothetical protein
MFGLLFVGLEPKSGLGRLTVDVSRSHTIRHTNPIELIPSHRPLPTQHKTSTRGEHPYPQRDSNPPAHQSSVRRPAPSTTCLNLGKQMLHAEVVLTRSFIIHVSLCRNSRMTERGLANKSKAKRSSERSMTK